MSRVILIVFAEKSCGVVLTAKTRFDELMSLLDLLGKDAGVKIERVGQRRPHFFACVSPELQMVEKFVNQLTCFKPALLGLFCRHPGRYTPTHVVFLGAQQIA